MYDSTHNKLAWFAGLCAFKANNPLEKIVFAGKMLPLLPLNLGIHDAPCLQHIFDHTILLLLTPYDLFFAGHTVDFDLQRNIVKKRNKTYFKVRVIKCKSYNSRDYSHEVDMLVIPHKRTNVQTHRQN